jgi:NAD(P)-dependent dehydrogenase (short-subunit alcohol dehydrogenase family)
LPDLDSLFSVIKEKKGRLDILFANAGGGAFVPLEEITEEHYDKYFGINAKGTLFTVQKALPLMPSGGSIVIYGSIGLDQGRPSLRGDEGGVAFVRSNLGGGLDGRNIRVNVVAPGTIVRPGYKSELGLSDEQIEGFKAQPQPPPRSGAPRAGRNGCRRAIPCLG